MSANAVRARYAPSPTGFMHIGNLRTALYEYLIAKSLGGNFILRIEDTDQNRFVEGAVDIVYKTLRLAGLRHDEGPDVGGPYGPYVQSERKDGYLTYAKELVAKGSAYYCFCTKERLAELRAQNERENRANAYDRRCLDLSDAAIKANLAAGLPYVIRQKMPGTGTTTFHDAVYGDVTFDNSELEDQILIKSDGMPTYNFANVIDDHLMAITHVVRGSEYLTSTPKYNLLYEAFGWEIPTYVHLPQIVKEGGKKISKREGDASFADMVEAGYLPEAIVNYVALLGWSPGGTREFFTLGELVAEFSIDRIGKASSTFDIAKLKYFNAGYIRQKTPGDFHGLALPYIRRAVTKPELDTRKIASLLQQRTEVLTDIPDMVAFFETLPDYDIALHTHKKMKTNPDVAREALSAALPALSGLAEWNGEGIRDALTALAERAGVKNSQLLWPLRVALSGMPVTPGGAVEIADILGRDESLRRVNAALAKLGVG